MPGAFFDEEQLIAAVRAHRERPAHGVRDAILDAVQAFVGDGIQRADIALIVVARGAACV